MFLDFFFTKSEPFFELMFDLIMILFACLDRMNPSELFEENDFGERMSDRDTSER